MPAVEMVDELNDELDKSPTAPAEVPEKRSLARILAFVLLPAIVIALGGVCGWLKWIDGSGRAAQSAATESVQAARDATIALLSYQPDTVAQSLEAAQSRLTGSFRESYGKLIHDVVIPGSREKKISSVANIPAAASISATAMHAQVLVFVNQTSIVGADAPTDTASAVRVGLDNVEGRWLISSFDPV